MDSNARGSLELKAEFRKPLNDAANRKYRRRSPVGGSSSSSDGQFLDMILESLQETIFGKKQIFGSWVFIFVLLEVNGGIFHMMLLVIILESTFV